MVAALTAFGAEPTLVGGMTLVILGSQRVTRDFQLKRLAHADRASASDAQDIAFLEARREKGRSVDLTHSAPHYSHE